MKKFLKDTRGVVMMEYVLLGCFAVAITAVTVLALGKVYNNGLATMAYAAAGETTAASEAIAESKTQVGKDINLAAAVGTGYAATFEDKAASQDQFEYVVFQ